jgi:hypothetical protein
LFLIYFMQVLRLVEANAGAGAPERNKLSAAVTAFALGCIGWEQAEQAKAAMTGLKAAECKVGTWEAGIILG